ncbi:copper resistance CopC family protein [Serinibacter arcticus]|uniref:copper resistance CopC family protein n=1 Tax=Serinibacter arcticus TaxID=1655435 RepID=UPI001305157C|nr:copper resistance CopC family protein [Serinibacter arcticus]
MALLLSFGLVAAPASAHDSLIASTPSDGETLTAAPTELTLSYSAEIAQIGADVVVTDPAGTVVSQPLTVAGTDVVVPLAADLAPGAYAIAWRVTSSDGHPIDGTLTFTLDVPAVASPTAEPTAEPTTEPTAEPSTSASETATEVESESASAEATETETAPAEDDATSNLPPWVLVVVALAVVGAIVALIARMRRDRAAGQGPHNR